MIPNISQPAAPPNPQLDVRKEVRFAVVMYGGVSLAIYINGVSQELLNMVRATEPVIPEGQGFRPKSAGELSGTETIYRKISYLLGDEKHRLADAEADLKNNSPIPTSFIVDIISGTSAGGINGIFLGKALANGQSLDKLSKLWIEEGDISKLLNDRHSIEGPLSLQTQPASLLNSQRLYYKLLAAFTEMEKTGKISRTSPFVKELDLFVPATDIPGVALPLRLADNVVYERRHRNVFHFKYEVVEPLREGQDEFVRNDFRMENNPFLAYAARCTSAFPFAFEPMRLCDIDDVLAGVSEYCDDPDARGASARWQRFFKSYVEPEKFPKRPFGDGGYLDNKPFSYATETLIRRTADVPVDRKLVYIEPSPEHPEAEVERLEQPDAVENVMAALALPRYETIREDLQRVIERNRTIERVHRILHDTERGASSLDRAPDREASGKLLSDEEWAKRDLKDMVREKGRAYLSYQHLEISYVTDLLATVIARLANIDEESDFHIAIRSILRAWREKRYTRCKKRGGKKDRHPTMNRFLYQFNLQYALRRLNFLRAKVDYLHRLDGRALEVFRFYSKSFLPDELRPFVETLDDADAEEWAANAPEIPDEIKKAVRRELQEVKKELNEVYRRLSARARRIQSCPASLPAGGKGTPENREPVSPLLKFFDASYLREKKKEEKERKRIDYDIEQLIPDLKYVLGKPQPPKYVLGETQPSKIATTPSPPQLPEEEECFKRAEERLAEKPGLRGWVNHFAKGLIRQIRRARREEARDCRRILLIDELQGDEAQPGYRETVRACLGHYYQYYDDYDMLTFPILYNTGVGESDVVEIVRISPEDAKFLIDEETAKCSKLAGTTLAHFGAFLDRRWRENDILWGRLDGAERLIRTLLPGYSDADELIGQAHAAIVCEAISSDGGEIGEHEVSRLLSESLMRTRDGEPNPDPLTKFIHTLQRYAKGPEWEGRLKIDAGTVRDYYLNTFNERKALAAEPTLRSAARATTVAGRIFEGLAEKYKAGGKPAAWVTRAGRIFWGMVEVATPRSLPSMVFQHWLKLLYLFEALLIASGTLFANGSEVQRFGWLMLGITLTVNFAVFLLSDFIRMKRWRLRVLKWMATAFIIVVVGLGLVGLYLLYATDPCGLVPAAWCETVRLYWPPRFSTLAYTVAGLVTLFFVLDMYGLLKRSAYNTSMFLGKKLSKLKGLLKNPLAKPSSHVSGKGSRTAS